jgi:hypothetical protein
MFIFWDKLGEYYGTVSHSRPSINRIEMTSYLVSTKEVNQTFSFYLRALSYGCLSLWALNKVYGLMLRRGDIGASDNDRP